MRLVEYRPLALRTAKQMPTAYMNIWHATVGMITETGELFNAYKREEIYGEELDKTNVLEEIGDLMWYLNLYAEHKGLGEVFCEGLKSDSIDRMIERMYEGFDGKTSHKFLACLLATVNKAFESETLTHHKEAPDPVSVIKIMQVLLVDLATELGSDMGTVLDMNIQKLAKRYGDVYSDYKAVNRDTGAERQVLDGAFPEHS